MSTLRVIGPALLTLLFAASTAAQQNACGNAATPPSIVTSKLISPPALGAAGNAVGTWDPQGGRLESQGIEYDSGDNIQVQVLTDGCTEIQSIQIGSIVLTPSASGSGSYPNFYWYSPVDTQNNTSGHGYIVWIGFPALGDGTTHEVVLTFVRSGGTGTVKYSFPLVHVRSVQPANTISQVGYSNTEIHNIFATSLNALFSGPDRSVVVNGTRFYDYDPSSLGTYIDSTGITFAFAFRADRDCKPRVRITGTFAIDTNTPQQFGLSVRWVNPAAAYPQIGWCDIAVEVLREISVPAANEPTTNVLKFITKQIDMALAKASPGSLLLDGTTTQWDELLINLKLQAPAIEIDTPYSAFDMTPAPALFPPGQVVEIFASGLGMHDYDAGVTPPTLIPSGPNGVPLHTPQSLSNAFTVLRTGALVDDTASVAQLLARFPMGSVSNGSLQLTDFQYQPGCTLTIPKESHVASPAIIFGVNDTTADAQRLRASGAGYIVRVVFGSAGSPCPLYTRPVTNR